MNPQLQQFVQELGIQGKALDLGCGDGTDMSGLKKMGWHCDGVDIITGTDLNDIYMSNNAPYDLVYSNYVIQKLEKPQSLISTIGKNLKDGGSFFLHTFDITDQTTKKAFTKSSLKALFNNTQLQVASCHLFEIWDDYPGHKHYHQVLQITGTKAPIQLF